MESNIATTAVSNEPAGRAESAVGVDMNLEVVTLPVADVDRSKGFYQSLDWRLDIDAARDDLINRGVDTS